MGYWNALDVYLRDSAIPSKQFYDSTASETIYGTSGNDVILSYGGTDTLIGGAGDDSYNISPKMKVVEEADQGIDTIVTWGSAALPSNVENLRLTSLSAWYGIGNALDNIIQGSDSRQQIDGGFGNDVLLGGGSDDLFVVRNGQGSDAIVDFAAGTDHVMLSGYGLTGFDQIKTIARQSGADTWLDLPGGEKLVLRNVEEGMLTAQDFQLELDRSHLIKTFGDEFNTLSLRSDGGTWRPELRGGVPGDLSGRFLPGESQIYVDPLFTGTGTTPLGLNPFSIANGVLSITASPTPTSDLPLLGNQSYVSGILNSKGDFSQLYGYFEIRAAMPSGQGFWPAFWMLPADGSWPPEIDIFEGIGKDPNTAFLSNHYLLPSGERATVTDRFHIDTTQLHTYGVDWTRETLKFYIDGVEVGEQATPAGIDKEMYLLANLAVGGLWGGAPDASTGTGSMKIDYIRAYANDDTVSVTVDGVQKQFDHGPTPIAGGSGKDYLVGTSGNDWLFGLGGDDALVAGAGDDHLVGGAGNDRLRGGAGADDFVFSPGSGKDVIVDYEPGRDHLLLSDFNRAAMTLTQTGNDVVASFGSDTITLLAVHVTDPHLAAGLIF